jgi:glycosyltransferase involved in cell wall biosynthesis
LASILALCWHGTTEPIWQDAAVADVGLVHDYLLVLRGAERTFAAMTDVWEDAPIYTLLYDAEGTNGRFAGRRIRTSRLQRVGLRQHGFRWLLPFFPAAAERLPVQGHRVVVSSSSAFAHGVRIAPGAVQVCYCHTPFRYAWYEYARAAQEAPAPLRPLVRRTLTRIREWDVEAAARVNHYIANSVITRERINEYYGKDAPIIHPPVEVDRFSPGEAEDWFLLVSELVPHKRIELALEAARIARVPVKVVGDGTLLPSLRERYPAPIEFLGRVGDRELPDLYRRARAIVVPSVEEFGIVAVEGQASGRPVLAAEGGGAEETVLRGETGELVPQSVDAFAEAMGQIDFDRFSSERAAANAARFSTDAFRSALRETVDRLTTGRSAEG